MVSSTTVTGVSFNPLPEKPLLTAYNDISERRMTSPVIMPFVGVSFFPIVFLDEHVLSPFLRIIQRRGQTVTGMAENASCPGDLIAF